MRKSKQLFTALLCVILFSISVLRAQEKEPKFYLTVTTMHWDIEMEDFSMSDWVAVEKEFLDKVTKKNEHVLATTIAHHYLTADNREAFFKKRNSYYSNFHSDEIYATFPGAKSSTSEAGKDIFYYVRKSHFAFPEDGNFKEFNELRDAYLKEVLYKNKYIKGYPRAQERV